ncbi:MAG TPA: 4Fe-4S dicluster domain-containing protein [Candidatus Sumerlaeota bacterium]|nr:4Fe-4S dicluster domain-containing protein [Candidatus Sumerlaeota bacterium]
MNRWQDDLRKIAARLLDNREVALVIGWGEGAIPGRTIPVFIDKPEDAALLVVNSRCENNLSVYIPRMKERGRLAIVAKPCDLRTIVSLIQEKQVAREDLHIISFACSGIEDHATGKRRPECVHCKVNTPPVYDTLIGGEAPIWQEEPSAVDAIEEFKKAPPERRWEMFQAEMAKCIRCYACRNACPMCYCDECFVERSLPRWIGEGIELTDTMIFHITRALHAAGRCGECGACSRACPMGVNLGILAVKINEDIEKLYHDKAGMDPDKPPAFSTFRPDDYNDFIK